MPSERFFYRPPDPGYASFGAGLASGVTQGVAGYYDERDRKAEAERQKIEDERRRTREDTEMAYLDAKRTWEFMQAGGGKGERPIPEYSRIDFGGMGLQESPTGLSSSLTEPVRLGPEPIGQVQRAAEDPNYRQYKQIGDYYIEDPESRARRIAQEEAAIARDQGRAMTGMAADALTAFRPDESPARAMGASELMGMGLADYNDLYPERKYPYTKQETEDWLRFQRAHPAPRATGGGSTTDRGLPTYNQAYDFLMEQYPGEYEGESGLPPEEIHHMAQAMARGEDVNLPGRGEAAGIPPGSPFAPVSFEQWAQQFGGGNVAPRAQPDYTAPMSDAEIADIRDALSAFPEDQWEAMLKADGVGQENIDRILGR